VSRGSLEKEEKRARVAASPVEEDERDPEGARDAGASFPRARDVDASSPPAEDAEGFAAAWFCFSFAMEKGL
jgi:hypothetical protein